MSRAVAAGRYLAADVVRSQRALLPVLAMAAVLAVLFGGDPGPLPAPWAASALALYPIAAWLALVVANTEEPTARSVTVAAAGGVGRVVAATAGVALLGDLLLTVLATGVPLLMTHYPWSAATVSTGFLLHACAATTGTAIGLLVARPLVARIGWSFCIGAVAVVVTAVQPWLPPVGAAVRALADGGAIWPHAVLGTVLAAAAAVVTWAVERGR